MVRDLLRNKKRLKETLFLSISTALCFGFSLLRINITESKTFLFLNWNLFLAFIPWAFTSLAILKPKIQDSNILVFLILSSWLLFFPNAPYILTDLFHIKARTDMPIWFDLVLILSFAWTGLLFGVLSLLDIEKILTPKLGTVSVSILSSFLLFISSFGIYLGRYLRWNSWDIISEPLRLMLDIGDRMMNPLSFPRTWGMTFSLGIFLNMVYWSFRLIRGRK